jgi:hypothetical protein
MTRSDTVNLCTQVPPWFIFANQGVDKKYLLIININYFDKVMMFINSPLGG